MNRKEKIAGLLLIIAFILILLCRLILKSNNSNCKVNMNNKVFDISTKKNSNNYYMEISIDNKKYPLKNNKKLDKNTISNIYYYSDAKYECILPVINDELVTDAMCYKESELYNYQDIKGQNNGLDNYIESLKEYDNYNFIDNLSKFQQYNTITIYKNSISKNAYITTYKGLYSSNNNINLFDDDIYENKISLFINNYYIVADYNQNYEFKYFYVVDLNNNQTFKIKSKNEISFDSYIQGVVNNNIYLYDRDNEAQYKINIDDKTVELIATSDGIKYYKNNKWHKINAAKANQELLFDYSDLSNNFTDYDYVIKNNQYGIYYLLKKSGKYYNVYEVNIENLDLIKYIFKTTTIDIKYKDDYLYFIQGNYLYYYSELTGLKTVLKNTEFEFNDSIKFYIY